MVDRTRLADGCPGIGIIVLSSTITDLSCSVFLKYLNVIRDYGMLILII